MPEIMKEWNVIKGSLNLEIEIYEHMLGCWVRCLALDKKNSKKLENRAWFKMCPLESPITIIDIWGIENNELKAAVL